MDVEEEDAADTLVVDAEDSNSRRVEEIGDRDVEISRSGTKIPSPWSILFMMMQEEAAVLIGLNENETGLLLRLRIQEDNKTLVEEKWHGTAKEPPPLKIAEETPSGVFKPQRREVPWKSTVVEVMQTGLVETGTGIAKAKLAPLLLLVEVTGKTATGTTGIFVADSLMKDMDQIHLKACLRNQ